jgi:uncharacterized protein
VGGSGFSSSETREQGGHLLVGSFRRGIGCWAGLPVGLIGIGGGSVIVLVVFYGLIEAGSPADQAAHVAVGSSLAAILPAALTSSVAHWRAGNTDIRLLRDWGRGIATGVVVAQLAAPTCVAA